MLKKGDIVLLFVVAAIVLTSFAGVKFFGTRDAGTQKIAVVKQNDKVIKKIDLDKVEKPVRIEIGGDFREVLLVEKGRIRFEEADCPDRICVKTGWLTKKGDVAVCLPNRTIIRIEGEDPEVDGMTY